MIAAFGAASALLARLPWQLVALALGGLVVWRATDLAHERGRADCEAGIRAAAFAERSRQAQANETALKTGAEIVTALASENARLQIILREIQDEARDLPDGDACGLGADGLRLLDRLGGPPEPGGSAGGPHPGL